MRRRALQVVFAGAAIAAACASPATAAPSSSATDAGPPEVGSNPWRAAPDPLGPPPWEVTTRIGQGLFGGVSAAITAWLKDLISSALSPVFDVFARTLFSTPEIDGSERLLTLWRMSLALADAALVVLGVAGGGLVIVDGGVGAHLTAKEALPRLLGAALAANLSLIAVSQMRALSNGVSFAVLGIGGGPGSVADDMSELVAASLTSPFLALVGVVVIALGVAVVAAYVLRVAAVALLVAAAPLFLVCHALPHSEHFAHTWWRATMAALLVPVAQSFVITAALEVLSDGELLGMSSSALIDLLVVSCLLYLLFKIPVLAAKVALPGVGARAWQRARQLLVTGARAVSR